MISNTTATISNITATISNAAAAISNTIAVTISNTAATVTITNTNAVTLSNTTAVSMLWLQGLIGDHDFERKVNDVKKYLDRGDMVKVRIAGIFRIVAWSGRCRG